MKITPTIFQSSPAITAGFTTRAFSPETESSEEARKRVARQEGFGRVASVGQVHGADVAVITDPGHIPDHDGLVTNQEGLLLTVVAADCALVLLADKDTGIIGACHSGWRGTAENIAGKTIQTMQAIGAETTEIAAYISPCISVDAFEVGEEVATAFNNSAVERRPEWPRPHVDLPTAIDEQIRSRGVRNVEISTACTASDTRRFYSYRAEGGTKGRMVGFIGLVERPKTEI